MLKTVLTFAAAATLAVGISSPLKPSASSASVPVSPGVAAEVLAESSTAVAGGPYMVVDLFTHTFDMGETVTFRVTLYDPAIKGFGHRVALIYSEPSGPGNQVPSSPVEFELQIPDLGLPPTVEYPSFGFDPNYDFDSRDYIVELQHQEIIQNIARESVHWNALFQAYQVSHAPIPAEPFCWSDFLDAVRNDMNSDPLTSNTECDEPWYPEERLYLWGVVSDHVTQCDANGGNATWDVFPIRSTDFWDNFDPNDYGTYPKENVPGRWPHGLDPSDPASPGYTFPPTICLQDEYFDPLYGITPGGVFDIGVTPGIDLIFPTDPLWRFNDPIDGGVFDPAESFPGTPTDWNEPTSDYPSVYIPAGDGFTPFDECKYWYDQFENFIENCVELFPFYP